MLRRCASIVSLLFATFIALPTFAQRRPPTPVPPAAKSPSGQISAPSALRGAHQNRPTCMQEAVVTRATLNQLQAINMETKSQVEGVCSNSSLSEQEKMQQIREIRKNAQSQRDGLISPQQREEIRECQKARAGAHPPAPHVGVPHAPVGPCGEPLPQGKPPAPPKPTSF